MASTTTRALNFAVYCFLVAIARSFATADSEINLLRGLKTGVHYSPLIHKRIQVVAWVQGFWDFIHAHENDPDRSAKDSTPIDTSTVPNPNRATWSSVHSSVSL